MLAVILVVPDEVFSIPSLPDGLLDGTGGADFIPLGDPGFNQPPPRRIVRIRRRQGPQAMQMVWEYDHGIDGKGMFLRDV